jgi:hypothetical protein
MGGIGRPNRIAGELFKMMAGGDMIASYPCPRTMAVSAKTARTGEHRYRGDPRRPALCDDAGGADPAVCVGWDRQKIGIGFWPVTARADPITTAIDRGELRCRLCDGCLDSSDHGRK